MFTDKSVGQEWHSTGQHPTFAPFFEVEPHTTTVGSFVIYESLASWLHRLCAKNGFLHSSDFLRSYKVTGSKASDAPSNLEASVAAFSTLTSVPTAIIRSLMLGDTLHALQGCHTGQGSRWLLRSSASKKLGFAARHAICPLCVGESVDAAWLQSWRLATATQCAKHGVHLLEQCPGCNSPFHIHSRRDVPLNQCDNCYLPIHSMSVEACSDSDLAPSFTLHVGQNKPGKLPVAQRSELEWWRGVRKILALIEDPKRALASAQASLPMEFRGLLLEISQHERQSFEVWPLKRRHCTIRFIDWLTTDWPTRFLDFLKVFSQDDVPAPLAIEPLPGWLLHARNIAFPQVKNRQPRRRLLLAPQFARLSIPVFQSGKKLHKPRLSKPLSARWSPQYAAYVVGILDQRILSMRGPVNARARLLRGALTLILEHGAPALLVLPTLGCTHPRMALAIQTVQAWSECLQHWHLRRDSSIKTVLTQPTLRLSDRRIAEMLAFQNEDPQLPLFAWTVQPGSSSGPNTP